jgi:NADH:ubiquinone oxidoreductase subunit K
MGAPISARNGGFWQTKVIIEILAWEIPLIAIDLLLIVFSRSHQDSDIFIMIAYDIRDNHA